MRERQPNRLLMALSGVILAVLLIVGVWLGVRLTSNQLPDPGPLVLASDPTTPEPDLSLTLQPEQTGSQPTITANQLRVVLITSVGSIDDGSINELTHRGLLLAQERYGFEYTTRESVSQATLADNIFEFTSQGYNIIVTVGYRFQPHTYAAAQASPQILFIGVEQSFIGRDQEGRQLALPNLVGVLQRTDQVGFLAGALGGMITQTGKLGVVVSANTPALRSFQNGFSSGATFVNPQSQMLSVTTPTFTDPNLGVATAVQLVNEGADVVVGIGDATGLGATRGAAEAGAWVIGVEDNRYETVFESGNLAGADRLLLSIYPRFDLAVLSLVEQAIAGTFSGSRNYMLEAANDGLGFAENPASATSLPPTVQARMQEILLRLADGSLVTGVDLVSGELVEGQVPAPEPFVR